MRYAEVHVFSSTCLVRQVFCLQCTMHTVCFLESSLLRVVRRRSFANDTDGRREQSATLDRSEHSFLIPKSGQSPARRPLSEPPLEGAQKMG